MIFTNNKKLFAMKKVFSILIFILTLTVSFAQEKVTFRAEIANRNGDIIFIQDSNKKNIQEIKINEKGIFESTFSIKEDFYTMFDGIEYAQLYLKNGYNLTLTMDAKMFDETISFKGKGANENNYLAEETLYQEKYNLDKLIKLNPDAFDQLIIKQKKEKLEYLDKQNLGSSFVENEKTKIDDFFKFVTKYYDDLGRNKILNNEKSPSFDYLSYLGKKIKLEDFAGKYVYIDVWATWCGPCIGQIPSLQKIESKFHDKNIVFISISVDEQKDFEKWKKFVADKSLSGVQLFADKNWNSDFIKAFGINSIPRFILIDPKGIIVNSDAPRPSQPELLELLEKLLN